MAYFVTGATGFIGRRLLERLLEQRQGEIYVLVREGSTGKLDELTWSSPAIAGGAVYLRTVDQLLCIKK